MMEPSIRICQKMPGFKIKCLSYDFSPLSCRTCTVPTSTRKPIEREFISIKEDNDMKNKTPDKMRNIVETLISEIGKEWTKIDVKKLLKKVSTTTVMFALLVKLGIVEKKRDGLKYQYRISPDFNLTDEYVNLISSKYSIAWSKNKPSDILPNFKHTPPPPPQKSIDVEKFEKKILTSIKEQEHYHQFRFIAAFNDSERIAMFKMARDNKQDAIVRKLVDAL